MTTVKTQQYSALVNIEDVDINDTGLYISRPENYSSNIDFLQRYFLFHFDAKVVGKLLEEKRQIDTLTENERFLLNKIKFPGIIGSTNNELEYVKHRIFQSHALASRSGENNLIMPFVSFLNHDIDGLPLCLNENGISISGRFNGEIFVFYHMGDALMILESYGFVTDTMFAYSLPMVLQLPGGIMLQIDRDISRFKYIDGKFRWPIVEIIDDLITVSWFPMYYTHGPRYPARFAASLASESGIAAEDILYSVFRFNLNALLPVIFTLKKSRNSYIQTVVSAAEKQLGLIGGIQNLT